MSIDANARCLSCDTPVHALCKDGLTRLVECSVSPDGEWEMLAGKLQERPIGSMVQAVMRYRDHARHCKGSLRPDPSTVPTRETGARKRTAKGLGGE